MYARKHSSPGVTLEYDGEVVDRDIIHADKYADTDLAVVLQDGVKCKDICVRVGCDQTTVARESDKISILCAFMKV
jgi:hypothetical protein